MTPFGWGRVIVVSYVEGLAGLVVAAALLAGVTLSDAGAFEAAAVLLLFICADVVVLRRAAKHPERLWRIPVALFVVSPVLFIGGLLVAVAAVPGFNIHGTRAYVGAEVVLSGAWPSDLGSVTDRLPPHRGEPERLRA